ncbi:MAG: glycosyltransferase [Acidimicrobiales bacterium]
MKPGGQKCTRRRLTLVAGERDAPLAAHDEDVVTFAQLRHWARAPFQVHRLASYGSARYLTPELSAAPGRFKATVALRALSRGPCVIEDQQGGQEPISLGRGAAVWAADLITAPLELARARRRLDLLARRVDATPPSPCLDRSRPPMYLRSDLALNLTAGGALAHTTGVLNHLGRFGGPPILLTTADIPGIGPTSATIRIRPGHRFADFPELARLHFDRQLRRALDEAMGTHQPAFLYQRASLNSLAGAEAATAAGIPLVLEYNGPEAWVARHWGNPLHHEALSHRVESVNLAAATVVVVVSEALAAELAGRGVDATKILVNPNGVDPAVYRPDAFSPPAWTGAAPLAEGPLIGFIGTFGPWHGAEVLARAFLALLADPAANRPPPHLLMVGDGDRLAATRQILAPAIAAGRCTFTGLVPQAQGPALLAACDVLVAPHVPNPDGSPFFGSPTKLFEYMATGRAIVASDLDQIGQVLEHDHTAVLVRPGDEEALAGALAALLADPGRRQRLGAAARRRAESHHTWAQHTDRIIDALLDRAGNPARP